MNGKPRPGEIDANGLPTLPLRWRLRAAWRVLCGHSVAYRLEINDGAINVTRPKTLIVGCRILTSTPEEINWLGNGLPPSPNAETYWRWMGPKW